MLLAFCCCMAEAMNTDRIEKLVRLFGASQAGELVIEAENWRMAVRRGGASQPHSPPTAVQTPEVGETLHEEPGRPGTAITAPLVGIFRQGERAIRPGETIAAG